MRQKTFIGVTVLCGLTLILCSSFDLLDQYILNQLILWYGIGVPLFLLMLDTIVDLNSNRVFCLWLVIGILTFAVSLTTYNSEKFIIQRSTEFVKTSGINNLLSDYSTSALKTLIIFLISYWPINKLLNKKGLFIVNTFGQTNWEHDITKRKITALDVVINILLYTIIFTAGLLGN